MSDFFDSELVQEELNYINELQQRIFGATMKYPSMSRDDKLQHVEWLTELMEKQKVMYTRLALSEDPEAKKILKNLRSSVQMLGFSPDMDMNLFWDSVNKTIQTLRLDIDR
tara:strand:+ start:3644 stop:3976 length:333 start_codon:yes stop_codon:yes gene_type:complete